MIRTYRNGEWKEFDRLYEAIGLDMKGQNIVSLIGGGGKTTTMSRLLNEYQECGVPAIITTTTHIQKLEDVWFLGEPSIEKVQQMIREYGKVWMGEITEKGKLKGFSSEFLEEVLKLGYTVFIEADGARKLPCKAPGPKEPVYVPETSVVLSVYGMDAIGKKIVDTCFRPELVSTILGKSEEDVLSPHDIAVLAFDACGGRKNITDRMDYQVILNKADHEKEQQAAEEIARELQACGIQRIHMTANLFHLGKFRFGKLKM